MIDTPCSKVCKLNASEICVGCGRTVSEVASWMSLSVAERQEVKELAKIRLKTIVERKNANER
jgi:predicted Fe-S protein YdhL (DUF1289 family)